MNRTTVKDGVLSCDERILSQTAKEHVAFVSSDVTHSLNNSLEYARHFRSGIGFVDDISAVMDALINDAPNS